MSVSVMPLEKLRRLCRRGSVTETEGESAAALATGFASLDAVLPEGGWPRGAITELLSEWDGIGELSLLMPALAQLTGEQRYCAVIAPPYLPYAPAWTRHGVALQRLLLITTTHTASSLWAAEQLLRCPSMGAVLAWPAHCDDRQLRRLQLAAEAGGGCGLLYRPAGSASRPSPAALRLQLRAAPDGLHIRILKARGGRTHAVVVHPVARLAA